ncbi:DUF58 domain-containing protein [Brevibacillus parabrevis]|uniref:DUF58 domain-containing protein n=1 Tax=Brevibacillus parabrevis TaxID=54914 RepID=UPI001138FD37|nr:DUF58 domain-containing protein [Brevibacillus parabrevis]TGV28133.1 DUF58 domain-containing protein [Mesorhizobium sp. M00.F.Ca.ET.186.01.1.1]
MDTKQTFHVIGFLLLLFGLFSGSWFLWLLGGFFFFMPAAQEWWAKSIVKWVKLEWTSDQTRVMPGTPVNVTIRLHNRSWLPLPATWLRFSLPEHVTVDGGNEVKTSNQRTIVRLRFDLPIRQSAARTLTLTPHKRGTVWLTEIQSETMPLFADEVTFLPMPLSFSMLVYPLPLPLPPLVLEETQPDGSKLSRQRQQEDVTFLRGTRPYMPGDRFKHIHWKATAKTGTLETRLFEHTAHPNWRIIGHILPSYEPLAQRHNDEANERIISCLAALSMLCRKKSIGFELFLTVKQRGREHFHLPAGSGKSHHLHVMTQLAQLNHYVTTPLPSLLRRLEESPAKEAVILVTARPDELPVGTMEQLLRRGHKIAVLDVSQEQVVFARQELAQARKRSVMAR